MAFCLRKDLAELFKEKLKTGEINPERLSDMTSRERNDYFTSFLGTENAREVNAQFESKLLLKNQKVGMITWAQKVAGLKLEARKDIIAKVEKLEQILNPIEERAFLEDLAAKKLGTEVTLEEAQKISELAKRAEELRTDISTTEKRVQYGRSVMDLIEYRDSLSPKELSTTEKTMNLVNLPKTLMSSLDFSAPFRQGWGMISRGEFWKAFPEMFKYGFSEKAYKDLLAEITTRPTYDTMKVANLRITRLNEKLSEREEAFMSSIADKIPGIRASERAYTGFLNKVRADVFDNLLKKAELAGEDITKGSQATKDLAAVVNNFSGSGLIGKGDRFKGAVPFLNALFYSPRKIAATVEMANPNNYLNQNISSTARQAALRNLIGSVGISTTILSLAAAMGFETETDPRSSDFGKVKVGNTRYDFTGGNASYLVLLARLFAGQTKSTTTEIVSNLGETFGSSNRADLILKYLRNKLSPVAAFVASWMVGEDPVGKPFGLKEESLGLVTPLIIQTTLETAENDPSQTLAVALLDMFGIGSSTYSYTVDWTSSTAKKFEQFKEKVGEEDFQEANNEYNELLVKELNRLRSNEDYQNLSEEDKQKVISGIKDDLEEDIFKKYKFKYKQEKTKKNPVVEELIGG